MMTVCDSCDIVFDSKYCPLCEAHAKIDELETIIDDLIKCGANHFTFTNAG